jgi:hypothetical protein
VPPLEICANLPAVGISEPAPRAVESLEIVI